MGPFLGAAIHVSHGRSCSSEHIGPTAVTHAENGEASQRNRLARCKAGLRLERLAQRRNRGSRPQKMLVQFCAPAILAGAKSSQSIPQPMFVDAQN